jgi:gag-polypeptide of LTR copia-type
MGKEYQSNLKKLLADGSNWVTYRDCFKWAVEAKDLQDHLTLTTVTQVYINLENVGNMPPDRRWRLDDHQVKQMIAQSVPNKVFSNIKMHTHAKDVWDALKTIFKGRSSLKSVNLGQHLQSTCCAVDKSIHDHFAKLADMREQLASMGETTAELKYALS